jgi:hypothetical protein
MNVGLLDDRIVQGQKMIDQEDFPIDFKEPEKDKIWKEEY